MSSPRRNISTLFGLLNRQSKQGRRPNSSPPSTPPKDSVGPPLDQASEHAINESAINRLPAEIFISILLLCSDDRDALLSVCRHWRGLINCTGQFWSTI